MTKRQLVDEIIHRNTTASASFLAGFSEKDLAEYLEHLNWLSQPAVSPALSGSAPVQVVAQEAPTPEPVVQAVPARPALQVVAVEEPVEEEPAEVSAYNTQEEPSSAEVVAVAVSSDSQEPLSFAQEDDRPEETWLF